MPLSSEVSANGSHGRRSDLRSRLGSLVSQGQPIIGAGAGTGLSAKFEERGGAHFILIYNSGKYRMAGLPSTAGMIAIGDANAIVMELGCREILPVVENTPVIAGVLGADPTRQIGRFLEDLATAGFAGVINFPTHGAFDGQFRQSVEDAGLGYDREVSMIREAGELGLFTLAYAFTPDEARAMAAVGVDVVVAHLGRTRGGDVGARRVMSLEEAAERTTTIAKATVDENSDVFVLSHGGPLAEPADVLFVLSRSPAVGFVGASSMERLPVEQAIEQRVREFTEIRVEPKVHEQQA